MTTMTEQQPRIDPSMFVYCPTHSEEQNDTGERQGPVMATYNRETGHYECGVCAWEQWKAAHR